MLPKKSLKLNESNDTVESIINSVNQVKERWPEVEGKKDEVPRSNISKGKENKQTNTTNK